MKNIVLGFIFFSLSVHCFAKDKAPVMTKKDVHKIIESFLKKEQQGIILERYNESLYFEQDGEWWFASYLCKNDGEIAPALGCDFSVSVTNGKHPIITYYPGR